MMRLSPLLCAVAVTLVLPCATAADTLRPLDEAALRATSLPSASATRVATPAMRSASSRIRLAERLGLPLPADLTSSDGGYQRLLGHPLFGLLYADVSARDVIYAPGGSQPSVAADGSLSLTLPQSVGEINLYNIRTGATDSNHFGSIQIRGLDLSRTIISVTPTR